MQGENKQILKQLKRWLKYNNPSYLAWKLGYRSTNVFDNWMTRNAVPNKIAYKVIRIIENDEPSYQD